MPYLLNLLYLCGLLLLSPWLVYKALTTGKYHRGMLAKLLGLTPALATERVVWFHGVSVGEIHLLARRGDDLTEKGKGAEELGAYLACDAGEENLRTIGHRLEHLLFEEAEEVLAVGTLRDAGSKGLELGFVDIAEAIGDLLGASDLEALTMLDGADEFGRLKQ